MHKHLCDIGEHEYSCSEPCVCICGYQMDGRDHSGCQFELRPCSAHKQPQPARPVQAAASQAGAAEKLWSASRKEARIARTVVLKLNTSEFKIPTRSHTPISPPSSCEELTSSALKLQERGNLSPEQRYRLVGIGLSNFRESEDILAQPRLFE